MRMDELQAGARRARTSLSLPWALAAAGCLAAGCGRDAWAQSAAGNAPGAAGHAATYRFQEDLIRLPRATPERPSLRADVDRVLLPQRAALRACFGAGPGEDAALSEQTSITLTVAPDGAVSHVAIGQSSAPQSIADCLVGVVRAMHFPPHQGAPGDVLLTFVATREPRP